ncbi:catalase family protein [Arenicella xantha]|uniref:Catalase n=1 Tax=Arenicella xantha TaxID=644221 RepID=A0A395JSA4_9GAMM|nr:catalase family protein [Arenicella xantha]RBP51570.1 catalase [Arenicella xantha]
MKLANTIKRRFNRILGFARRWGKRILFVAAAYALLFVGVFIWQMAAGMLRNPDADLVDNSPAAVAQRDTDNAAIIESVRQLVDRYRTPEYQRDAHSKAHGCVRATFDVFESQSVYNHGLFREPGRYQAWIRFSNGTVPALADTKKDARGMAIKVMNVEGKQLLPAALAGKTQDFVMINSPAFFIRTIEGYRELERLSAEGKPFTYFFGEHYLNPFKWNLRELYLGLGTRTTAPNTPLSTQYYSMSPYKLGPHQIKYSAKACENYDSEFINKDDPNFLRNAMASLLRTQDACFQFMVQIRDPDARMPIQDTTVRWSEKDAPFIPVARIHIPKQEFDTPQQNAMCEAMSFNPWHAIQEHEPLGYINELRRDLYLHTAAYRRVRNGAAVTEPNSWCDSLAQYCDSSDQNLINSPALESVDGEATSSLVETDPISN